MMVGTREIPQSHAKKTAPQGGGAPGLVVRNLPDPALLPPPSALVDDPTPRAVYVGDVRTSRGLRTMVEAIALAPVWRLDIVGPVAASDQAWLNARLTCKDIAGRVTLHGRKPPSAAWRIAVKSSVGMILAQETPAFRDAVPTKLYEYLAMGLAVLATPLPRVAALLDGTGAGVLVADARETAETLRGWSAAPAELAKARAAALDWAARELGEANPYDVLAREVAALVG
jgi:glycosyltransferase involved in cell wall biosynthesis